MHDEDELRLMHLLSTNRQTRDCCPPVAKQMNYSSCERLIVFVLNISTL